MAAFCALWAPRKEPIPARSATLRLAEALLTDQPLAELDPHEARTHERKRQNRAVIADLLRGPLRDAKAAGTVRRDLSMDDVLLMLRMARGAMAGAQGVARRSEAGHRALALIMDGVVPSSD